MAIEKHKTVAKWALIEAGGNLFLSIVLVKTIGIYGVAWGTSLVTAVVHLVFWPRYVHKVLDIPVRKYLWQGWGKITICSIPYGIACIITDRYWHPGNLFAFFSQIVVTLPIYAVCVLAIFRGEAGTIFRRWQASRLLRTHTIS
jgi:O-antigen/teichoic acid export membrane protein